MHKNFRKFSIKYLGKDPLAQSKVSKNEEDEEEGEEKKISELIGDQDISQVIDGEANEQPNNSDLHKDEKIKLEEEKKDPQQELEQSSIM